MKGRFGTLTVPETAGDWLTIIIELPVEHIQYLCVIFEAYDNFALVRTPWGGSGCIYVYTWDKNLEAAKKILTDIGAVVPLRIREIVPGMKDLDALWQD